MSVRRVIVLGSTGSVGTQALEVVAANPGELALEGISAGRNVEALCRQAIEFGVARVAIADPGEETEADIRARLSAVSLELGLPDRVESIDLGPEAVPRLAAGPADVVLNAVTSAVGLRSTLAALEAGTDVALANKESLIVGGELVLAAAAASGAALVPVDSEHSAIAQCLRAGTHAEVRRLVVTASGGPFRGRSRAELDEVTPSEALAHPTWDMGRVITTNSATLVNKGLEVIEAHLLFDIDYDDIDVVVHPQSQIHSMVEFVDGATIAQVSPPDMKLPIAYALGTDTHGFTRRLAGATTPNDWTRASTWTFEPVDREAFGALDLAYAAGRAGGCLPAVYNAANEVLVDAFHDGFIRFPAITEGIATALEAAPAALAGIRGEDAELTLDHVLAADAWARAHARERVARAAPGSDAGSPS